MEKYPSIVELAKCPEIFHVKQVIACEKVHGGNFRLFFPLGMKSIEEIGYGSRDVERNTTGVPMAPSSTFLRAAA